MSSTFKQTEFQKGIQASLDSAKVPEGGYYLGINVRNRENVLAPVKKPVNLVGPLGLYQGLFAAGPYLLLICSGEAYIADTRVIGIGWQHLDGFLVDQTAPEVDALLVPISSYNWMRSGGVGIKEFQVSKPQIRGSPAGALVTDGITQPWLIQPTPSGVTAYKTQTYEQWAQDQLDTPAEFKGTFQEYVPIGRFPLLAGKKSYLVGLDEFGRRTLIFPSVSGRPLDFVINVGANGSKAGDAKTTSEQVSFDDITAMYIPSTSQGEFIVCTLSSTFLVTPRYDSLLFAEPTYLPVFLFQSGAVNHRSFVEVHGNVTYIGQHGINKFDAVAQIGTESNNLPFAKEIRRYFSAKAQQRSCAIKFDDYALYSIDSVYGPAVAVYDMTNESWTSLDIYQGLGKITQFAETVTPFERRLFAITSDNQVYEMFNGAEYETPRVYIGDLNTGDAALAGSVNQFAAVFGRVYENFEVSLTHFRDQRVISREIRQVVSGTAAMPTEPISVPFNNPEDGTFKAIISTVLGTDVSITAGFMIEWTSGANLSYLAADVQASEGLSSKISALANAKLMAKCKPSDIERYAFIADMSPKSQVITGKCADKYELAYDAIIRNIVGSKIETVLGGGDYLYLPYAETIPCHWPADIRFIFAPGNHDLDRFQEFYPNFGGKRYYRTVVSELLDVFVLNGGWKTSEVVMNSNRNPGAPTMEPDGIKAGDKQMLWLRSELALSRARWKIILIHEPPYSSTSTYFPGYADLRHPYRAWGADLIMSGHGHSYERFFVDGATYIVAGTGGHSLVPFAEQRLSGSVFQLCAFGHIELTVDPFQLQTEFVRYDGKRFDQFRIGA